MNITLIRSILLAVALLPSISFGGQFSNIQDYYFSLSGSTSDQVTAESSTHIFGIAKWQCSAKQPCSYPNKYIASLFVLEKLSNGQVREVVRSKSFEWEEDASTPAIDTVEIKQSDRFDVRFHRFSPTGSATFVFALRDSVWLTAGLECESLYMLKEYGDEAVGDSRSHTSINLLTGQVIEEEYRSNKLHSKIHKKNEARRIPLAEFNPFNIGFPSC